MKAHRPVFIQLTRASYAKTVLDSSPDKMIEEIMIRDKGKQGLRGEVGLRWYDFSGIGGGGGSVQIGVQLGIFSEGWEWLSAYPELFEWMAHWPGDPRVGPTPDEIVSKLNEMGFENDTPEDERNRPVGKAPRPEILRRGTEA